MKQKLLVLVALLSLAPGLASAGEEASAPSVTGETGLFSLLGGDTAPQGGWTFGLYVNNWDRLIDLNELGLNTDEELSLDWSRVSASIGYGITDRWELSVMVPYESYEFDADDIGGLDFDAEGIGNLRVGTKFRLTGERGGDTSLALTAFTDVPTGDEDVASDDAGFGVGLGWGLDGRRRGRGCGGGLLSGRQLEDVALEYELHEASPLLVVREGLDLELAVEHPQVSLDGIDAQVDLVGDLLVGRRRRIPVALSARAAERLEDFLLSLGEPQVRKVLGPRPGGAGRRIVGFHLRRLHATAANTCENCSYPWGA